MMQTYEAVLQPNAHLQFLDLAAISSLTPQRVLVTFTEEFVAADTAICGVTLSESALTQEWQSDEEDAAWAHLQAAR